MTGHRAPQQQRLFSCIIVISIERRLGCENVIIQHMPACWEWNFFFFSLHTGCLHLKPILFFFFKLLISFFDLNWAGGRLLSIALRLYAHSSVEAQAETVLTNV